LIEVWRICARRHAPGAFSGNGARLYGGRWKPPGVALIYTAGSLSLAALELFVHLDPADLPQDLVSLSAAIPDGVARETISIGSLPPNWREYPAPESTQEIGKRWADRGGTAVLAVPSAVIPQERNFLLNPAHPQYSRIQIRRPQRFQFDARMGR
jgi:RES domain-containing protein